MDGKKAFIDMRNDSGMITEHEYLSSQEAFNVWLYDNYSIGNGHTLLTLQCDSGVQIKYLNDNDLPLDTDIK